MSKILDEGNLCSICDYETESNIDNQTSVNQERTSPSCSLTLLCSSLVSSITSAMVSHWIPITHNSYQSPGSVCPEEHTTLDSTRRKDPTTLDSTSSIDYTPMNSTYNTTLDPTSLSLTSKKKTRQYNYKEQSETESEDPEEDFSHLSPEEHTVLSQISKIIRGTL